MRFHAPEIVFRHLTATAKAQGRTKASLICEALVRLLGLEGIPLDPREIYGEEAAERPEIEPKKKIKKNA
jgi:hypothetical protein